VVLRVLVIVVLHVLVIVVAYPWPCLMAPDMQLIICECWVVGVVTRVCGN